MIHAHDLPRMLQRGLTTLLDITVKDDDGSALVPAAAKITVYKGDSTTPVVDDAAATPGATSTYSLADTLTADESLSTEWQEVWTLTIAGSEHVIQRSIYLCRYVPRPVIDDTDLEAYHSDILDHIDPGETTLQKQREKAWSYLQKRLIRDGRRPELVLDNWELADAHAFKTLEIFFRDSAQSVGDERWKELRDEYAELFKSEWNDINFHYDADEDGRIDDDEGSSAVSTVWLC